MLHPNPNILLRIAQADAYAMATEYIKLPRDQGVHDEALAFRRYCEHPRHFLRAGQYTDDTQMSIAVAETIVAGDLSREAFADSFVRCFKRDQRGGYAGGFLQLLQSVNSGGELLVKIRPESDKNGAAMRSVPLGVLSTPKQVAQTAEIQAKITHNTPDGILSSQIVALMSYYAMHTSNRMESAPLITFLSLTLPTKLDRIASLLPNWEGPVTGPNLGMNTAHAVFDLVISGKNLIQILRQTIEWGGDTDTVAAIAWGIASIRDPGPVPDFFETGLEPGGKFGVDFLKRLGKQLI